LISSFICRPQDVDIRLQLEKTPRNLSAFSHTHPRQFGHYFGCTHGCNLEFFSQPSTSFLLSRLLTGVGFLGAGVIMRDPGGHVTGLTTAATVWMCAVLGIVCGLGYWGILGITVALTTLVLLLGRPLECLAERIFHRHISGPPDHSV
jgi:hypothetical protein